LNRLCNGKSIVCINIQLICQTFSGLNTKILANLEKLVDYILRRLNLVYSLNNPSLKKLHQAVVKIKFQYQNLCLHCEKDEYLEFRSQI